ncbi:hypothetical protein GIB67_019218 [Kingdonia uniflora]|uniref:Uncharacterized protein n=1 Tax=Kingdonia uniflora TaxID=39325 RepID=A0A7J7MZS0_9MAGN|nr:hypothetical protein GIB67_019218 [Kingdonia uniflora]
MHVCLQVNYEAKKYKTAPLQHRDLLEKLFDDLSVRGASSTPASNDDTTSKVLMVLKDTVSSYEIDNTLFFKGLKLLRGKDEHNYMVMFLGIEPEQCVGFLEALLS